MKDYLPLIVSGIVAGSIYALAATGLVLSYISSGVLNFAHGAIATVYTFVFYVTLREGLGLPTWVAAVVVLGAAAPVGGLVLHRFVFTRLLGTSTATQVVTSLGLLVALQGLVFVVYGGTTRYAAPLFPTSTFRLPGVNVGWDQLSVVVLVAACVLGLTIVFRKSDQGLRTRSVVEDRELAEIVGVNSNRVMALGWIIGTMFAALSGMLLAPTFGLSPISITLLIIVAFGGAVIGRLQSFPLTYAGSLIIGVAASLSLKVAAGSPNLRGLPSSIPFIVLLLVLVLSRKDRFWEASVKQGHDVEAGALLRRRASFGKIGLGVLLAAVLPPALLSGGDLGVATQVVVFVLVFSSLALLIGLSRQVSLSHAVFVAVGGAAAGHALNAGVPFPLAVMAGGLAVVPLGALVAISAIRLSGLFLALATLGFGVLAQNLIYSTQFVFGVSGSFGVDRPSFLGLSLADDKTYYWICLAVVVGGVLLAEAVWRTRLGRVLAVLGDSPRAAMSLGVRVSAARLLAFCFSAALAGLAGALLGPLFGALTNYGDAFGFFQSLLWVSLLVVAGSTSISTSVVASVLLIWVPYKLGATASEYQPVLFGLAAMIFAGRAGGLVGLFRLPPAATLVEGSQWRLSSSPGRERRALAQQQAVRGA
jgi:branched-subunit amino acid ABC-type transport system permease component